MFGGPVYRGDLFLALGRAGEDEREREAVARLWGFDASPPAVMEKHAPPAVMEPETVAASAAVPAAPAVAGDHFSFWRATRFSVTPDDVMAAKRRPLESINQAPYIREAALEQQGPPLPPAPLLRWSRLWPFLKRILGHDAASHSPDIPRTVRMIAQGKPLTRLPVKPRQRWHPKALLLMDRRDGLAPFWEDYDRLQKRLTRLRGSVGLKCVWIEVDDHSPTGFSDVSPARGGTRATFRLPCEGTAVLALGDLEQYRGGPELRPWLLLGRRMRSGGILPWALSPCPPARWDGRMARTWNLAEWDRGARPPSGRRGSRPETEDPDREVPLSLPELLSPALRVEIGLLREIRCLLPDADVGAEYDLFQSPETVANPLGIMFHETTLRELRARLGEVCADALAPAVAAMIRHHAYAPAYLHFEILALHYWLREEQWDELSSRGVLPANALDEATRFYQGFLRSVRDGVGGLTGKATAGFLTRDLERLELGAFDSQLERQIAWALAAGLKPGDPLPEHIDPEVVARLLVGVAGQEPALWHGQGLIAGGRAAPGLFPVVEFKQSEHLLSVSKGPPAHIMEWSGQSVLSPAEMRDPVPITVASGGETAVIERITRPAWARRMWYDRHGLAAEFSVKGVPFVLRWIPPGRFLMGSPEDEPGRYRDEGPRHEVVIREGYWLGETPVTQAQWKAVTGRSPSHFQGPGQLPVESVSWADCREYCRKISRLAGGPVFRLPSEAEWEYACRAGTETALWTGGITIKADHDAPELEDIAWYLGNSWRDSEVSNPRATKDFQAKHPEGPQASTHRVKRKSANPWGLHDMLGNVWEWCEDPWDDKAYEKIVAGETPVGAGNDALRVVRGGSWRDRARGCRAAFRNGVGPGNAWDFLGLRLAAGQEPGGGAAGSGSDPAG